MGVERSEESYNRVQVLYQQHDAFLYGLIHSVDGDLANQWAEKPFVISKSDAGGVETVYGTVARTLKQVWRQLERIGEFNEDAGRRLKAAGIDPVAGAAGTLPESKLADRILDEQEQLVEDVLIAVSVNVRILGEIFRARMNKAKVGVYDYDGANAGRITLKAIADLLLHNRYLLVKGDEVVDLISDQASLLGKPQLGLKIKVDEYLNEVQGTLDDLTINDLIGVLRGAVKRLSASSDVKDKVFVIQNLYTLGGLVVTDGASIDGGPLKTIMDRVALEIIERMQPRAREVRVNLLFTSPRFGLEPDLNDKKIGVSVKVNGKDESLVMGYEEFFSMLSSAHGETRLRSGLDAAR